MAPELHGAFSSTCKRSAKGDIQSWPTNHHDHPIERSLETPDVRVLDREIMYNFCGMRIQKKFQHYSKMMEASSKTLRRMSSRQRGPRRQKSYMVRS